MRSSVPLNPPRGRRAGDRREGVAVNPARAATPDEPDPAVTAAVIGERIRRVALGLTAALVTARAYTTSEPDL